jgi:hypothetical protein
VVQFGHTQNNTIIFSNQITRIRQVKNMDKKKLQLEFFTQFLEEKNLQEKWEKFKDENTFELAKIFRNQDGIKESYNDFLADILGINLRPSVGGFHDSKPNVNGLDDLTKPSLTATEVNVLLQSDAGQKNLKKWGYLKNEQI